MDINDFDLSKLSPELKEKLSKCRSKEEVLDLIKTSGIELTDEQLDLLSGGKEKEYGDFQCDAFSDPNPSPGTCG
ncbi:hypothetical protein BXO88_13305 [Oribacterium sp. C9]|uniref:Nif11-like leader peptide family natural product precursor n=1 Tax=Oribacterium sp. C9 TaxID=1943579 RepID=UPI00098ED4CE|nr:Nif11-like leader peptide family natural product precursor [Oribacterium sp. C9]OON85239.1 hypothetical protein BXO88_13305 [Oribacterium sp. C9]